MWVSAAIYTSAAVFAAGFFTATVLMARPATQVLASADISDLWTTSPKVVEPGAQHLDRVAALSFPKPQPVAESASIDSLSIDVSTPTETEPGIDRNSTGSIEPDNGASADRPALSPEHLAWCERRYRSYDPQDNSYRSYSGSRRTCQSPFLDQATAETGLSDGASETGDVMTISMSGETGGMEPQMGGSSLSDDHIRRCSARYASYDPADNSYRAFSGDRRPCLID